MGIANAAAPRTKTTSTETCATRVARHSPINPCRQFGFLFTSFLAGQWACRRFAKESPCKAKAPVPPRIPCLPRRVGHASAPRRVTIANAHRKPSSKTCPHRTTSLILHHLPVTHMSKYMRCLREHLISVLNAFGECAGYTRFANYFANSV